MKIFPYNCKFCGKPGEIKMHDEFAGSFESLLPLAACNRCADFYSRKSALVDRMKTVCIAFYQDKYANPKGIAELEAKAREKLSRITKAFCTACADYLYITNVWEPEFIDQLIDNPRRFEFICGQYFSGLSVIAKDAHSKAASK